MSQKELKAEYPHLKDLSSLLDYTVMGLVLGGIGYVIYSLSSNIEDLSIWTIVIVAVSLALTALVFYFLSKVLWLLASIDYHSKNSAEALMPKEETERKPNNTQVPEDSAIN
ncbi:MAG: hypothetical protein JEZ14_15030 [Marinilabiliaceae bacterium]|nr:hypothetical protein [Marinilabiliaceae bacterium]